ncbi:MAG TPA: hypothetical protein VFV38_12560 [Ktedonobacteraceae bacterium]|nr:hypothetical protein [Ktedonobacteraceae bacterium]
MADDLNKMVEQTEQERYRQENEMARGPVSRGASNKEAPMYQNQRQPATTRHRKGKARTPDYNKMIKQRTSGTPLGTGMETDQELGSIGGGTIPEPGRGTGEARGGIATSSSTVAGGGTSGGGLIGKGITRDRGTMSDEDMDTSTNNALEMEHQAQGKVPTRIANSQSEARSPRKHRSPRQKSR